jgi:hypothetical protein
MASSWDGFRWGVGVDDGRKMLGFEMEYAGVGGTSMALLVPPTPAYSVSHWSIIRSGAT